MHIRTYVCVMYCVYVHTWVFQWRLMHGVELRMYVCLCVFMYMYVPYETPLIMFYPIVICAVTSIQLHSALRMLHNLRTYVHTYVCTSWSIQWLAMIQRQWLADFQIHTYAPMMYICISYILPAVFTLARMHTHTLTSSPNCSQPLPQGVWCSLQGHTTSGVTGSTQ